jgi:hypothetical protein
MPPQALWDRPIGRVALAGGEIGWVRRWRRRHPSELWTVEEVTVVTSRASARNDPAHVLALVRGHWTIENRVHWTRDVSSHEDRWHGRAIGPMLSLLRNMVLNLIRRAWPRTFIPDAWSRLSRDPQIAVRWLNLPLMN